MNKFYVTLLCIFTAGAISAQSPGGIGTANLALWLNPDALTTAGPLTTWNYANNGNSFAAGPTAPSVVLNSLNSWSAVQFNGAIDSYMAGPNTASAPLAANQLAYAIFAVWSSPQPAGSGNMRIWAQRQNTGSSAFDGASLFIYPGGANSPGQFYATSGPTYGDQPEVSPFTTGVAFPTNTSSIPWQWTTGTTPATTAQSILAYAPQTNYISSLNLLNANTNDLELMDQTNYGPTPFITSTDPFQSATTNRLLTTQENLLGARTTNAAGDENFNGNLYELIVTNISVTAVQREQIFSYLSLKYGIPLPGSYISSGLNTYWDASANGSYGFGNMNYNNNVFGIGEDLSSGITLKTSNSSATAGVSGAGNIVLANPSALADQGFMMVGSNNAGFAETTTNLTPLATSGSQRLANQWVVQNTGTVGTVDLSFDFTGIATTGTKGNSNEFALVVDRDGDGDFTTGTATQEVYMPTSWDGTNNVATFSQVNLAAMSGSSVVISILSNAAAGTPLPVNWVSFTAKANGPDVDLNWTVSANENAKVYDVQRSADGSSFTSIGQVSNDPNVKSYGYVDANAGPGTHYYRVLETDQDGKSIYSKIVSVNMSGSAFAVRLINNPVVNGTDAELEITAANSGNASMEIWALGGSRVETLMQEIANGTSRIRIPMANLAPGTYAVKIRVNDVTQTVQVVKL